MLWHTAGGVTGRSGRTGRTVARKGWAGLCLKGRGGHWGSPQRLQSGHRGCESGWGGRLSAVGNAVGGCCWGMGMPLGWSQGDGEGGREGGSPPLQAIPWGLVRTRVRAGTVPVLSAGGAAAVRGGGAPQSLGRICPGRGLADGRLGASVHRHRFSVWGFTGAVHSSRCVTHVQQVRPRL